MLRHFAPQSRSRAAAALLVVALTACGIKGPLRPATTTQSPAAAPPASAPSGNPQARPPLLSSEPPTAIAPPEPAKKP